jgi:hypothetical protein
MLDPAKLFARTRTTVQYLTAWQEISQAVVTINQERWLTPKLDLQLLISLECLGE